MGYEIYAHLSLTYLTQLLFLGHSHFGVGYVKFSFTFIKTTCCLFMEAWTQVKIWFTGVWLSEKVVFSMCVLLDGVTANVICFVNSFNVKWSIRIQVSDKYCIYATFYGSRWRWIIWVWFVEVEPTQVQRIYRHRAYFCCIYSQ